MSSTNTIFFESDNNVEFPNSINISTALTFLLDWYNENGSNKYVFHNYNRAIDLAKIALEISEGEKVSEDDQEAIILAALFLETNLLTKDQTSDLNSLDHWRNFNEQGKGDELDKSVEKLLTEFEDSEKSSTLVNILRDAKTAATFRREHQEKLPLLRLEEELVQAHQVPTAAWNARLYQIVLDANYLTATGKSKFLQEKNLFLGSIAGKVNKSDGFKLSSGSDDRIYRPFEGIEKKVPSSGIQTYFRTNYRNHINLSAIADNKANIMISVNAILISVVISILSYQNIPETDPMVILPVVIFLVTGMTSLIFAVLSIRPKVTMLNGMKSKEEQRKNLVFFGNFVSLSLEEFEEGVDSMLRNGELLYGNMVRDIYYLGQVLDQKYKYLTLSYNTFMVGFIATVMSFLLVLFL